MRRRGFTLVEVIIVVMIIGILSAIAVPQFLRAREAGRQKSCLSNLRALANAKEQYAMEMRMRTGDAVSLADLTPTYVKPNATCAAGGSYTINVVGTDPVCSYTTGMYPHVLP